MDFVVMVMLLAQTRIGMVEAVGVLNIGRKRQDREDKMSNLR